MTTTAHDVRSPLLDGAARLSCGLVLVALVLAVVARDALVVAGPALLAVAAVAGLPHGAADVTLLRGGLRPLAVYGVAALAALAVALAFPGPSLVVLLALSVAHFAEGEQGFDRLRGGRAALLPAAAVGTCAVVLPVTAHPAEVRPLLEALSPTVADAVLAGAGRSGLLLVAAALAVAAVAQSLRAGDRRTAGEVVVVAALLAVAPPLAGFAVWFAGWHAVRHTARLVAEQQAEHAASGRTPVPASTALAALGRRTLLPSLVAAAGLGALVAVTGGVPPAVVLGLLALTVPHAVVVARELRPA